MNSPIPSVPAAEAAVRDAKKAAADAWAEVAGKKGDAYAAAMTKHALAKGTLADAEATLAAAKAATRSSAQQSKGDEVAEAQEMLRKRFVYGAFRNEVWDRRARDWISMEALSNLMAHAMPMGDDGPVRAGALLVRDPEAQKVHNERYTPGSRLEIVEADGIDWLNTWTPPKLKPAPGDPMPMLQHILFVCNDDKAQAAHLTDWLAFLVQHPGAKIKHAPLIISPKQGIGKDTIAESMKRILGEKNVVKIKDRHVAAGRNEFMIRKTLVCVPEIMSGDRKDVANALKDLITDEMVYVDEKNIRPYEAPNTVNFLFFSNHENAAHIEDNDRRYFVVICRQQPKPEAYFEQLYAYINGPELAGFAHFLATRDLSHFNPDAHAPDTADKAVVKRATRGGTEAWLEEAWENGTAPFDRDVISLTEAMEAISENRGAPRMTIQQLSAFLKKEGRGGEIGRVPVGNDRPRLWAVRHFDLVRNHPNIVGLYKGDFRIVLREKADPESGVVVNLRPARFEVAEPHASSVFVSEDELDAQWIEVAKGLTIEAGWTTLPGSGKIRRVA